MATGAADPTFLDTNVLVLATTEEAPFHDAAVRSLRRLRTGGTPCWISRQILREYLATLSRAQTFAIPQPVESLIADIEMFQRRFRIAEDGPQVTPRLLALMRQVPAGGKQVHDANIVATLQAHGVRRLLTHNTADFARFGQLIEIVSLDALV
jgi:predicted nucleic acid-binding protein